MSDVDEPNSLRPEADDDDLDEIQCLEMESVAADGRLSSSSLVSFHGDGGGL